MKLIPLKCLYNGCQKPAVLRGVCSYHMQCYRKRINAGEVTDEELVKTGELSPKKSKRCFNVPFKWSKG